jgi:hypothetical protein
MATAQVGTFASSYEQKESVAQRQLEETIEFFKDNEN